MTRWLVTPVELVKPCALEEVVGNPRKRRRLVQAAKLNIGRGASGHVEDVQRDVGSGRLWEQRIIGDSGIERGSDQCLSKISVRLFTSVDTMSAT